MNPLRYLLLAATIGCASAATAQATWDHARASGPPEAAAGSPWREHVEARRTERLRALHEVLGIQPNQEAAFDAFAQTMDAGRPEADQGPRDGDRQNLSAAMTTPQRVEAMKAMMNARIARLQSVVARRSSATLALYQVLDDRQRRIMDALPLLAGGHGQGLRGRG